LVARRLQTLPRRRGVVGIVGRQHVGVERRHGGEREDRPGAGPDRDDRPARARSARQPSYAAFCAPGSSVRADIAALRVLAGDGVDEPPDEQLVVAAGQDGGPGPLDTGRAKIGE
jgi:hypothetical protein